VAVQQPKFDEKWMWTDAAGACSRRSRCSTACSVSENPYCRAGRRVQDVCAQERDAQWRQLSRAQQSDKMKRLVRCRRRAHAAGEIERLMKAVREDKMPLDDVGIEQPLEPKLKSALLESAAPSKRWCTRQRTGNRRIGLDSGRDARLVRGELPQQI